MEKDLHFLSTFCQVIHLINKTATKKATVIIIRSMYGIIPIVSRAIPPFYEKYKRKQL
jgi:hypothetical protein